MMKPAVVATWSFAKTSSGMTTNTPGAISFEVRLPSRRPKVSDMGAMG